MISFESDYIAGAHPKILKRLVETNLEILPGYGSDVYCKSAAEKIKAACEKEEADVYFLAGGTQTNQIIVDTMLAPYQGVIAAKTGHINGHEAGAIEYTGHKVLEIKGNFGKIDIEALKAYVETFYADANHDHMVFPGMVYISFPTEYGTIYTKEELSRIYEICRAYEMVLFIDGARLGYGLCCDECDITLPELARLCDVFYIGGTKVGALCGEAVVFAHHNMPAHFLTLVKRHGALLAKDRLLGVQFDTLFTDGLYFEIGRYAIEKVKKLHDVFEKKGYRFFLDSPTNQLFVVLQNDKLKSLSEKVRFGFWEKYDEEHTVVRIATSWSTTDEEIALLEQML